MWKAGRVRLTTAVVFVAAGVLVLSDFRPAEGRTKYKSQFEKRYPLVKKNQKTLTCLTCHGGKADDPTKPDYKQHNNYGTALKQVVGKNEMDGDKIDAALQKIEAGESAIKGQTFGDLLKSGKLPASKE
jgi:hypothetical protein